jgi:hypothetical protein
MSHKGGIHGDVVMLHVENEIQETLLRGQLSQLVWYNWHLTYYDVKQNIRFKNLNPNPTHLHLNNNPLEKPY